MVSNNHTDASESAVSEQDREAYCESQAASKAQEVERRALRVMRDRRLGRHEEDQAFLSAPDGKGYKDPDVGQLERSVVGPTYFAWTDLTRNDTITRQTEQQLYAKCLDDATQGEIARWQRKLDQPDTLDSQKQQVAVGPVDIYNLTTPWWRASPGASEPPSQDKPAEPIEAPKQIAQQTGTRPLPALELMEPPAPDKGTQMAQRAALPDLEPIIDDEGNPISTESGPESGQQTRTAAAAAPDERQLQAGQIIREGVNVPDPVREYAREAGLRIRPYQVYETGKRDISFNGTRRTYPIGEEGTKGWCVNDIRSKWSSKEIVPCVPAQNSRVASSGSRAR